MAIEFQCEHCSTMLRVPDEHAGKPAKCPQCQSVNQIPQSSQLDSRSSDGIQPGFTNSEAAEKAPPFHQEGLAAPTKAMSNPYAASNVAAAGAFNKAHRGSTVLTLGILSLVCNLMLVPGILAWIFGHADIKEMDAGRMDPEGRGMTYAGMILGIIGTVLPLLFFLLYLVFIVIIFVFAPFGL